MRLRRKRIWPQDLFTPELGESMRRTLIGGKPDEGDAVPEDATTYQVTLDHAAVHWGPLQMVKAYVAGLVTELVAHDERYAIDAQTMNLAFNSGAVQEVLDRDGEWSTVFGMETGKPHTLKVTAQER